ncbi:MAG: adenylate/guanylate cyclase domain-containing protein [Desulfobacterales bacterium]|nr:adenylate/guanylate cyclase domain-containing protein [Desulfobacterales bacterium]
METQPSVSDKCRTSEQIKTQVQILTKTFVRAIAIQDVNYIEPGVLLELSDSELQKHENPAFCLSEICRLLIRLGDRESLGLVLSLSYRIYTLRRSHKENGYLSYLYRGIAQIGLKQTDIGIKNVLIGISDNNDHAILSADISLGYWALMSAAVVNKNIKMALRFAEKWRGAARKGGLKNEIFRSEIVIHIFHLLLGNTEEYSKNIETFSAGSPEEWKKTVLFLREWTEALTENRYCEAPEFSDPCPLFLGFEWHISSDSNSPKDFCFLCEQRRRFCTRASIENSLSDQKNSIDTYANLMADWEISGPLREFEAILKNRQPDNYLQFTMTRVMGKRRLEKVTCETAATPEFVMRDNAIILVTDIRKYSKMSEQLSPAEIFDILNPVFKIMYEELEKNSGAILEFIGDCIIVVFNTFTGQHTDISDILSDAVRCLQRVRVLSALSLETGLPEIQLGMGINKGLVALGYLGGLARCHLTVLGNTINIASRLETASKGLAGDIIVSGTCFGNKPPDVWTCPMKVNYSVRDLGMYDKMKNICKPAHLFGIGPLLKYWIDFVPMGMVAKPEKGVVYIDAGNSEEPGIIDHHCGRHKAQSACELLVTNPGLLLDHLRDIPASKIEFRVHKDPDQDCAASLYAAYELMDRNPRKEILFMLADYISKTDQGIIPRPDKLDDSLYGIFVAHKKITQEKYKDDLTDLILLEAGMRVIDAAVHLMERQNRKGDFSDIFSSESGWFDQEKRLIRNDTVRYNEDLKAGLTYKARVNGHSYPVTGLWLSHPKSVFFKLWARTDPKAPGGRGYQFLAVDLSQPETNRFVISVDPESATDIEGLGQLLEAHESDKRKRLGMERPVHPIRFPSDNSDPWYFGQGHRYTIIDSPRSGTVLTGEEVRNIHKNW